MRMISTDPEFTWNGTVFIVLGFTVFGLAQGIAIAARRATQRRWVVTTARTFGFVGTLPLFVAAGGIMFPTVIGGGLARHRTDWPTWTRAAFVALGCTSIVFVAVQLHDDWGWGWRWWAGMAGLFAVYGAVISMERGSMPPQLDGWRIPGLVRIAAVVVGLVAMLLPVVGAGLT
jgi:hypothetical protein